MKDNKQVSSLAGYVLAGSFGALVGAIGVLIATRAIPKMMSQMMDGMMANMFAVMAESGCSPTEI